VYVGTYGCQCATHIVLKSAILASAGRLIMCNEQYLCPCVFPCALAWLLAAANDRFVCDEQFVSVCVSFFLAWLLAAEHDRIKRG
jgi:hypothetical protein